MPKFQLMSIKGNTIIKYDGLVAVLCFTGIPTGKKFIFHEFAASDSSIMYRSWFGAYTSRNDDCSESFFHFLCAYMRHSASMI